MKLGVFGANEEAIVMASNLAMRGYDVVWCVQDDTDLEDLEEGDPRTVEAGLRKYYKDAFKEGKFEFKLTPAALFDCDYIFFAGRLVRDETDIDRIVRLLEKDLIFFLEHAKRYQIENANLVLLNTLPCGGYEQIMNAVPFPKDFSVSYVPIISDTYEDWFKPQKRIVLIGTDEKNAEPLRRLYRNLGTVIGRLKVTDPYSVERVVALKDTLQVFRRILSFQARDFGVLDLYEQLSKYFSQPSLRYSPDQLLLERMRTFPDEAKIYPIVEQIMDEEETRNDEISEEIIQRLTQFFGNDQERKIITLIGFGSKLGNLDMMKQKFIELVRKLVSLGFKVRIFAKGDFIDIKWRLRKIKKKMSYSHTLRGALKRSRCLVILGEAESDFKLATIGNYMVERNILDPFGLVSEQPDLAGFNLI